MRVPFDAVFQTNPNGSISPKTIVTINGVTMSPGVALGGGVSMGGVDLTSMRGKDLEIEKQGGGVIVTRHY